jgi:hypothetical protein
MNRDTKRAIEAIVVMGVSVAVHESRVANVQKSIERRNDFSDASVDPTEARNAPAIGTSR